MNILPVKLLQLVEENEGFSEKPYRDIAGVLTCGYGFTENITENTCYTKQQAEDILKEKLIVLYNEINSKSEISLTENQLIALTDFAYNLGINALFSSHLWEYLQENKLQMASDEFLKWCHTGNVVVLGLLNRRKEEQKIFNDK